jgi:tetratricopeptide (TPR) repeat protein
MTGDLEAAKDAADRALARPDVDFYLYYLQALVIYRLSRNSADAALASLKQAMAKNPGFAPTYYLRGKIKMDRNDLAGALNDFETATRLDAKYALPLYKMAQIYRRLGRQSDAENAAQRFKALGAMREEEVLSRQTQDVLMPAAK